MKDITFDTTDQINHNQQQNELLIRSSRVQLFIFWKWIASMVYFSNCKYNFLLMENYYLSLIKIVVATGHPYYYTVSRFLNYFFIREHVFRMRNPWTYFFQPLWNRILKNSFLVGGYIINRIYCLNFNEHEAEKDKKIKEEFIVPQIENNNLFLEKQSKYIIKIKT